MKVAILIWALTGSDQHSVANKSRRRTNFDADFMSVISENISNFAYLVTEPHGAA